MPTINDSVQFLKGVGPAFAKKFEKLGILTIRAPTEQSFGQLLQGRLYRPFSGHA